MVLHRLIHWFSVGCIAVVVLTPAADAGDKRAVIELFTSQGCSSCPPADRLLGELTRDHALVALSLSVDYWDYLGWKDTLSLPSHTKRQRGYAKSRGDRHIYTPQAVINGVVHAIGSDPVAIERAIARSRSKPETMAVPVRLSEADGRITVALPDSPTGVGGEVWLCSLRKAVKVTVKRGENRGKTVVYHNVVRGWHKVGDWDGKAASWTVSRSDLKGTANEAAVIVQERPNGYPGRVLGAATVALK